MLPGNACGRGILIRHEAMMTAVELPQLPGFRVLGVLGAGASGTVYHAIDEGSACEVALKLFEPADQPGATQPEHIEHERRIAELLRHRNLTHLHAAGAHGERRWLAWEYLEGGSLEARIARGMRMVDVLDVMRDVVRGLGHAHAHGVVHGDVKPGNILFRANGEAVLGDYGVAVLNQPGSAPVVLQGGTPDYMSPEQKQGLPGDGRSDFYSLGVVLHEMLTGRRPQPEQALALPVQTQWLRPLLESLLAEDPADRPTDAAHVQALMASVCAASPQAVAAARRPDQPRTAMGWPAGSGRRLGWIVLVLVLLIALIGLLR